MVLLVVILPLLEGIPCTPCHKYHYYSGEAHVFRIKDDVTRT